MDPDATGGLGLGLRARCARRLLQRCTSASARRDSPISSSRRPPTPRKASPVGQKIAHAWEWGASKLRLTDHSVAEYLLQGKPPQPGEVFRQPNLARTWRELGKHGRDYFYAGDLAGKIVAASDAGGGHLKLPDLAAQRSEWMDPISATYRGHRVVEMPPNGQGLIVLMALRILEGYDLAALFRSDLATAEHLILEALKLSFADAERYIGDPRFGTVDVRATALRCLHRLAAQSDPHRPRRSRPRPPARFTGNTTYFTVVDKDRNAVSFITSISDVFGSGMVAATPASSCTTGRPSSRSSPGTRTKSPRESGRATASFQPWSSGATTCT